MSKRALKTALLSVGVSGILCLLVFGGPGASGGSGWLSPGTVSAQSPGAPLRYRVVAKAAKPGTAFASSSSASVSPTMP